MPIVTRDTPKHNAPTAEQQARWEQAAHTLLESLDVPTAQTTIELAYVHNRIPLWAMVMGHLRRAYETGELSAPVLDPSWPRSFPNLPDPLNATYKCERCQATFSPARFRQRYCTSDCGAAAAHEGLAAAGRL